MAHVIALYLHCNYIADMLWLCFMIPTITTDACNWKVNSVSDLSFYFTFRFNDLHLIALKLYFVCVSNSLQYDKTLHKKCYLLNNLCLNSMCALVHLKNMMLFAL